jgi:hypothetical protein
LDLALLEAWAADSGLEAMPAAVDTLVRFLSNRGVQGLEASTTRHRAAVTACLRRRNDHELPTNGEPGTAALSRINREADRATTRTCKVRTRSSKRGCANSDHVRVWEPRPQRVVLWTTEVEDQLVVRQNVEQRTETISDPVRNTGVERERGEAVSTTGTRDWT